ncbi:MAG: NAD(+) diphosphatase [Acidiferrobacterales bacterium]|nr:NAD(+) diphosphatase [Acidiferrobacterales bacterium]
MSLTRHTDLCRDSDWLNQQLASDDAKVLTLWAQKNMVRMQNGVPQPVYLPISEAALILGNAKEVIYLGHEHNTPVFAADLGVLEEKEATRILDHAAPGTEMIELRKIGAVIDPETGSLFAYARGLAYWHQQNPFCARCGSQMQSRQGGHARRCTGCNKELFPRIDPAVIMLIEQAQPSDGIPRCLLGRGTKWEKKMYSTLAGYVDAGESLEQAVIREVQEEAGLKVSTTPIYVASQPWPFPGSIMLGFRAKTHEIEISIDTNELVDARWFSRAEIRDIVASTDQENAVMLPPTDSIARLLIDQWLAEG